MVESSAAAPRDLSSLRFATSAGEALPVELYQRWTNAFGVDLLDGLGTAEMWHIFITNRPGDIRPGTLGRAVDGFDVRVRDDQGRDLPAGETGLMWVRGHSRATAYWQNMEATRRAFRGEWYVSEDMLSRDEDGYFTYCGRADDMLKVSGKWLSPGEVENCLLQHPAVREVAVVGMLEADGLTRPHAFVVVDPGPRDGLEAQLADFVTQRLEAYKAPRSIVFMDALPRTHLGKVDRGQLRNEVLEGSGEPGGRTGPA
jgi:acyl-coenzyme A synthetase/AMP-(fatty) acid ligase